MRKIHVKVVLDVLADADESIVHPEDYIVEAIADANIQSADNEVNILDIQVKDYEVTDSR